MYYEEAIIYVIKDPEEKGEKKWDRDNGWKIPKWSLTTNSRNPMNPKCRINLKKSTPKHIVMSLLKL